MRKLVLIFTLLASLFSFSALAQAYIGPGMAGGVIAATIGLIVAILAALFGIIYYPTKRYLKRKKKKNKEK